MKSALLGAAGSQSTLTMASSGTLSADPDAGQAPAAWHPSSAAVTPESLVRTESIVASAFHVLRANRMWCNSYVRNGVGYCTLVHGRYLKGQYRERSFATYARISDLSDRCQEAAPCQPVTALI